VDKDLHAQYGWSVCLLACLGSQRESGYPKKLPVFVLVGMMNHTVDCHHGRLEHCIHHAESHGSSSLP
jgi:hypothetical protein